MASKEAHCPTCGRKLVAGTKSFDGFMANLFILAVRVSKDTTVEWKADRADPRSSTRKEFMKDVVLSKDIRNSAHATRYARLGDLKLWGLLRQEPGHWHQGIYQLTDLAKEFLQDTATIPRRLLVSGGKMLQASQEQISLEAALGSKWNEIAHWIQDWRKKHTTDEGTRPGELF